MTAAFNTYTVILMLICVAQAHAEQPPSKGIIDKVGNFYSDTELQMKLASAADALPCLEQLCEENQAFDARVKQFGEALATQVFLTFPDLKRDVPEFTFTVAEKREIALASNKLGLVVVFRGVQPLMLSDHALKFLIAREMAHVIAKHHDKNVTAKLLISALTAVAFPAVAIVVAGQAVAVAEASALNSVMTSAASTATSIVGSEVAVAKLKPRQLLEADEIALALLRDEAIDLISLAAELKLENPLSAWEQDLHKSYHYLSDLAEAHANWLESNSSD